MCSRGTVCCRSVADRCLTGLRLRRRGGPLHFPLFTLRNSLPPESPLSSSRPPPFSATLSSSLPFLHVLLPTPTRATLLHFTFFLSSLSPLLVSNSSFLHLLFPSPPSSPFLDLLFPSPRFSTSYFFQFLSPIHNTLLHFILFISSVSPPFVSFYSFLHLLFTSPPFSDTHNAPSLHFSHFFLFSTHLIFFSSYLLPLLDFTFVLSSFSPLLLFPSPPFSQHEQRSITSISFSHINLILIFLFPLSF